MARAGSGSSFTIDSLKQRMARDPLSRAFLQLAEEYRKAGRFEEAVQVCLEGLARHPTYHTARISLGRTYLEAGDLENARRALAEVLELAPENHLAGKLLAEVQRLTGDHDGAVTTYRAILRHYPADREVEALLNDLLGVGTAPSGAPPIRLPAPPPDLPKVAPAPPRLSPVIQTPPAAPRPTPVIQTTQSAQRPAPAIQAPQAAMEPAFDYNQEDLGLERAPGPTGNQPAAPPPSGRPVAPGAGLTREGEDALQTNTLAELYLRQGLVDRAVEVYRAMLRVDPENDRARLRLQDLTLSAPRSLEGPANGPMRRPGVPEPAAPAARAVEATPARAARPATVSPDPQPAESPERVVRLERWLRSIRSGSADPGEIRR